MLPLVVVVVVVVAGNLLTGAAAAGGGTKHDADTEEAMGGYEVQREASIVDKCDSCAAAGYALHDALSYQQAKTTDRSTHNKTSLVCRYVTAHAPTYRNSSARVRLSFTTLPISCRDKPRVF